MKRNAASGSVTVLHHQVAANEQRSNSRSLAVSAALRSLIFLLYFFSYCPVDANVQTQIVTPPEESANIDASLSSACQRLVGRNS
jgi:hypothetical protein